MKLDLNATQVRVLGCLIEKQLTTPDYYPLTLSALTNACNQKSNREPVMSLSESEVLDEIHSLVELNLAREQQVSGARVLKYAHKLSDTLTKQYDFSQNELGILSVLFVRGPQTLGEIRTRTTRMCNFPTLLDAEQTLQKLVSQDGGPYVAPMAREPGRREIRHQHLFAKSLQVAQSIASDSHTENPLSTTQRSMELDDLRAEVTALRADVELLKETVNQLTNEAG